MSAEALSVVTDRLRLISEPTRVRLMWLLDEHGPATVQELGQRLPVTTYANISRHLVVLYQAGIVGRVRQGTSVRYELVDWTALWVIEQVASSVAFHLEAQSELLTQE
jgi:DNA-binding transcriptional ArsR family regulator